MSRFSRKTATGLGYLLFAVVGGAGFWTLKFDGQESLPTVALQDREKIALPVALGPSIDYATELSAVVSTSHYSEPSIDLSQHQPTWINTQSKMVPIETLVSKKASQELPTEYPYGHVRPMAVPRSGNAIVRPANETILSLAPKHASPFQEATPNVHSNPSNAKAANEIPMVSINASRSGTNNAMAATQLEGPKQEASWHEHSMLVLKELGRTLMTPPPPQSTVTKSARPASNQFVAAQKVDTTKAEALSEVKPAQAIRPADQPKWQEPVDANRRFIIQPTN